eukprot:g4887.t1
MQTGETKRFDAAALAALAAHRREPRRGRPRGGGGGRGGSAAAGAEIRFIPDEEDAKALLVSDQAPYKLKGEQIPQSTLNPSRRSRAFRHRPCVVLGKTHRMGYKVVYLKPDGSLTYEFVGNKCRLSVYKPKKKGKAKAKSATLPSTLKPASAGASASTGAGASFQANNGGVGTGAPSSAAPSIPGRAALSSPPPAPDAKTKRVRHVVTIISSPSPLQAALPMKIARNLKHEHIKTVKKVWAKEYRTTSHSPACEDIELMDGNQYTYLDFCIWADARIFDHTLKKESAKENRANRNQANEGAAAAHNDSPGSLDGTDAKVLRNNHGADGKLLPPLDSMREMPELLPSQNPVDSESAAIGHDSRKRLRQSSDGPTPKPCSKKLRVGTDSTRDNSPTTDKCEGAGMNSDCDSNSSSPLRMEVDDCDDLAPRSALQNSHEDIDSSEDSEDLESPLRVSDSGAFNVRMPPMDCNSRSPIDATSVHDNSARTNSSDDGKKDNDSKPDEHDGGSSCFEPSSSSGKQVTDNAPLLDIYKAHAKLKSGPNDWERYKSTKRDLYYWHSRARNLSLWIDPPNMAPGWVKLEDSYYNVFEKKLSDKPVEEGEVVDDRAAVIPARAVNEGNTPQIYRGGHSNDRSTHRNQTRFAFRDGESKTDSVSSSSRPQVEWIFLYAKFIPLRMTEESFSDIFRRYYRSVFVKARIMPIQPGRQSKVGFVTLYTTRPHARAIISFINELKEPQIKLAFKKTSCDRMVSSAVPFLPRRAGTAERQYAPSDGAKRPLSGNSSAKKKPNNGNNSSSNEEHSSEPNQGKATDNSMSTSIIRDSVSAAARSSVHDANSSNDVSVQSILMQPQYFRSSPAVGMSIHKYLSEQESVESPVDLAYLSEEDIKTMLESLDLNTKVNRRKMRNLMDWIRERFGIHDEIQMSQQF